MPKSYYSKKESSITKAKTIIFAVIASLIILSHSTVPTKAIIERSIFYYVKSDINDDNPDLSATNKDVIEMFYAYNNIDVFKHYFYSTAHIHNRYQTKDRIACFGILGIVIPVIDWDKYIVKTGPIKRHYYRGGKKDSQYTPLIGNKDYDTGKLPDK